MKFLWKIFKVGLKPALALAALIASTTKTRLDDEVTALLGRVEEIFFSTEATSLSEKIRSSVAVVVKKLLLSEEFLVLAKLNEEQAGNVLVAFMSVIKPDAADTEEEIAALREEAAQAVESAKE